MSAEGGLEMRKLQLTGGSSIAITLPKRWVERSGLGAGDVVGCLVRQDGSLLVTPRPGARRSPQVLQLELAPGEGPEHLFRRLVAAYLNGYDHIKVHSRKALEPRQRATVRAAVKRAMGLEVVDETPHGITVQDFLDPTEFPLEKGVRRMAAIAQQMHQDAMSYLGPGEAPPDGGMEERDNEVDRLSWLVNKQYHALLRDPRLGERLQMTPSQALNHLLVARLVERTADHAVRIAENAGELKGHKVEPALLRKVQALDEVALGLFRDAMASFWKRDPDLANEAIGRARGLHRTKRDLVHELMELRGQGPRAVALAYVLESIERTGSYGSDIAEIAINHVVAQGEA